MTDYPTLVAEMEAINEATAALMRLTIEADLTPEQRWLNRWRREGKGWQFEELCPRLTCMRPIPLPHERGKPNVITGRLPCQCRDIQLSGSAPHAHGLIEAMVDSLKEPRRHAAVVDAIRNPDKHESAPVIRED